MRSMKGSIRKIMKIAIKKKKSKTSVEFFESNFNRVSIIINRDRKRKSGKERDRRPGLSSGEG